MSETTGDTTAEQIAKELDTTLARHIIDTTDRLYVDRIQFDGTDGGPWLAVTGIDDSGVVIYSDGTGHTEAWQGGINEIVEKAQELLQETINDYQHLGASLDDIEYDESHDPVFDLANYDLEVPKR